MIRLKYEKHRLSPEESKKEFWEHNKNELIKNYVEVKKIK